jgi:SHS2 domain-containing protein
MDAGWVQAEGGRQVQQGPPRARWERFTRGSDVGIRGIGRSCEQAFEMAAVALGALVTDPRQVEAREEVELACEARATEQLLADWLRAVVHAMALRRMRFHCFAVRLDGPRLFGHGFGEHADPARHPPGMEVTGATLTEVSVRRGQDGMWTAECLIEV